MIAVRGMLFALKSQNGMVWYGNLAAVGITCLTNAIEVLNWNFIFLSGLHQGLVYMSCVYDDVHLQHLHSVHRSHSSYPTFLKPCYIFFSQLFLSLSNGRICQRNGNFYYMLLKKKDFVSPRFPRLMI